MKIFFVYPVNPAHPVSRFRPRLRILTGLTGWTGCRMKDGKVGLGLLRFDGHGKGGTTSTVK
ncbi:MAG TPA: hypothetical protein VGJ73_12675, partial [Verrucomicrobiae bacterium]